VSLGLVFAMMSNIRNLFHNLSDEFLADMSPEMQEGISGLIYFPSLAAVFKFVAIMLVYLLVVYLLVMMAAIFVLTISHVRPFSNNAGLWIFLFLLITAGVCVAFIALGTQLLPQVQPFQLTLFAIEDEVGSVVARPNLTAGFLMLVLTAILFFLTNNLLKRKISLK
jgi:hypothetical protein